MTTHYGFGGVIASIITSEAHFNEIKNRVCKNINLSAHLGDFIMTYNLSISGQLKPYKMKKKTAYI